MKRFVVLAASICMFVAALHSQESTGRRLSLDDAISKALDQNINVLIAQNNVETAENNVISAFGAYIPQPYASATFIRTGYSSPPTVRLDNNGLPQTYPRQQFYYNTYQSRFGLAYTIFDGFNREANMSSASSSEDQANMQLQRTKQLTVYSVQSSYLNVLRNEQLVKVAEENIKRDKRQLDRISESNRVGAASIADVYRQQSIVANDEVNLISAQNTYDKSKADLLNLLALDPSADYAIVDPSIDEMIKQSAANPETPAPFDDLVKQALGLRPDYMSTKSAVDVANNSLTRAWSPYYPSLSARAEYSTSAPEFVPATTWNNRTSSLGLTLSWQLPELFGSYSRISNARVARRSAELQLEQKERDVRVEVKKSLLDLEASRKQLEATQKSLISAEQDHRVAEERYNLGAGTLVDLYVANASFVNAQANNVNANYNYIIARRNLEYVVGERSY